MTLELERRPVAEGARYEAPDADGIGSLVIDRPDDAVNALNPALIEALAAAVEVARADRGLRGLIVCSAKPGQWIAGADLKLVTQATNAAEVEAACRRLQDLANALASLPCTTVAALNGHALGGGFELALACDYRVAAEGDAVTVGLPEVSLGLIPAGGGTQRLPRLVGLAEALDLILTARRFNARRARAAGLIDEVVHPAVLDRAARAWAAKPKRLHDSTRRLGLDRDTALDLAGKTAPGRRLLYRQAEASVAQRTGGHYPAPARAIEAVRAGVEHGVSAGFAAEVHAFGALALSPEARHLISLFLATQHARHQTGVADPSVVAAQVNRLGVVGSGFMGAGIAEVAAAAGLTARVRDVSPEAVAKGLATIAGLVQEGVARRRFDRWDAAAIRHRVSGTVDYAGFATADLVIEAVFEDLALKRQVLADLEGVVGPEAVIASNTSALPIRELQAGARHPERVLGMHFFSPVHRMPLLEIVRTERTSDQAVATAAAVGARLGKTVIVVGDGPGFYTTRVLGVMLNEAALLLAEGAAIEDVDAAMTRFGFPVGPFVLVDEVGLPVAVHVGETLVAAFGDRQPAARIVADLAAAGRTGKRAGRGFYVYHANESRLPGPLAQLGARPARTPDPAVYELLGNPPRQAFGQQAIQDRLVLLFVNEAIRCLQEGVLRSPTDGDLGAVLGLGFPPFLGGPFHYADALGASALRDRLAALAAAHGPRYEPADLLRARAEHGDTFHG